MLYFSGNAFSGSAFSGNAVALVACQLLAQATHPVTAKGLELKVFLFVLALSVNLWVATEVKLSKSN